MINDCSQIKPKFPVLLQRSSQTEGCGTEQHFFKLVITHQHNCRAEKTLNLTHWMPSPFTCSGTTKSSSSLRKPELVLVKIESCSSVFCRERRHKAWPTFQGPEEIEWDWCFPALSCLRSLERFVYETQLSALIVNLPSFQHKRHKK